VSACVRAYVFVRACICCLCLCSAPFAFMMLPRALQLAFCDPLSHAHAISHTCTHRHTGTRESRALTRRLHAHICTHAHCTHCVFGNPGPAAGLRSKAEEKCRTVSLFLRL